MAIEVGAILEGKISGIAKFGAFVALEGGSSGLVHISEVSSGYVTDIEERLTVGQDVKVKVLNVDEKGRINLSIKQAEPVPPRPREPVPHPPRTETRPAPPRQLSFEDMLSKFKQDSDSKLSDLKASDNGRSRKRTRK